MGRARRALAVAALVLALFVALALSGCDRRVLVCVSGWSAEDDWRGLRLLRRDGTLVPCYSPTTICSGECDENRGLYASTHNI